MSLEIVSLKNNILKDVKYNEVKQKIINRLNELNLNQPHYKNDQEYLLLICNLIEHLIIKKDEINKLDLINDIYITLFNIDDLDKETLKRNIDFLHKNKQIKKVSYFKLFLCGINEYFFKKK